MAKKFGKFVLFVAAAGSVAAGIFYFFKKKSEKEFLECEDEDYDDFSEDSNTESRSYVQLNPTDTPTEEEDFLEENEQEGEFSPLAEQLQEKKNEQVEEFFGEEN